MWKPGQLITINGRVYRVKRTNSPSGFVVCELRCGIWLDDNPQHPIREKKVCLKICLSKPYLMPDDCYLERITPKHI